jgi:hypothetical protein
VQQSEHGEGLAANIGRSSGSLGTGCQHMGPPTWAILQRAEMKGTLCFVASLSFSLRSLLLFQRAAVTCAGSVCCLLWMLTARGHGVVKRAMDMHALQMDDTPQRAAPTLSAAERRVEQERHGNGDAITGFLAGRPAHFPAGSAHRRCVHGHLSWPFRRDAQGHPGARPGAETEACVGLRRVSSLRVGWLGVDGRRGRRHGRRNGQRRQSLGARNSLHGDYELRSATTCVLLACIVYLGRTEDCEDGRHALGLLDDGSPPPLLLSLLLEDRMNVCFENGGRRRAGADPGC